MIPKRQSNFGKEEDQRTTESQGRGEVDVEARASGHLALPRGWVRARFGTLTCQA